MSTPDPKNQGPANKAHDINEARDMTDTPRDPQHERLCAYLLGEAEPAEVAALEAALADDPALRTERDRLAGVLGLVQGAFGGEERLSEGALASLLEAAQNNTTSLESAPIGTGNGDHAGPRLVPGHGTPSQRGFAAAPVLRAAAAILMVATGVWVAFRHPGAASYDEQVAHADIQVGGRASEARQLVLGQALRAKRLPELGEIRDELARSVFQRDEVRNLEGKSEALFREAQAAFLRDEFDDAGRYAGLILEIDPSNETAGELIKVARELEAAATDEAVEREYREQWLLSWDEQGPTEAEVPWTANLNLPDAEGWEAGTSVSYFGLPADSAGATGQAGYLGGEGVTITLPAELGIDFKTQLHTAPVHDEIAVEDVMLLDLDVEIAQGATVVDAPGAPFDGHVFNNQIGLGGGAGAVETPAGEDPVQYRRALTVGGVVDTRTAADAGEQQDLQLGYRLDADATHLVDRSDGAGMPVSDAKNDRLAEQTKAMRERARTQASALTAQSTADPAKGAPAPFRTPTPDATGGLASLESSIQPTPAESIGGRPRLAGSTATPAPPAGAGGGGGGAFTASPSPGAPATGVPATGAKPSAAASNRGLPPSQPNAKPAKRKAPKADARVGRVVAETPVAEPEPEADPAIGFDRLAITESKRGRLAESLEVTEEASDAYYAYEDEDTFGRDALRGDRDSGIRRPALTPEQVEEGVRITFGAIHDDCIRRPHERPRDMYYRWWGDNPWEIAETDHLSTFAADVDTASYVLARRYLREGNLPTREQIRTEEFVNYFDPDVPAPTESTFAVATELAPSLFGGSERRWQLRVGVRGKEVQNHERQPLNLTFVVDTSGSMEENRRLELVKHALRLLVGQLDGRDMIAIVAFNKEARLVLPLTSAANRGVIESALHPLSPDGGTNAEAGLLMGYEVALTGVDAQAHNRVILLSDGVANIGETDQDRINQTVTRHKNAGVYLNTIGVGMNNHNDVFLEQLANKGDGICDYVDDAASTERAIVERFVGALVPIASDVKIQVEFDPAQVLRYRLLGYENRAVADADFRNDKVDAGEVGAGHQVTAIYEIERAGAPASGETPLAQVRLRWKEPKAPGQDPREIQVTETSHEVLANDAVGSWDAASTGFRRASLVAQFAEVLRASTHARGDSLEALRFEFQRLADLPELAQDTDTAELPGLVQRAIDLGVERRAYRSELSTTVDEYRRHRYLCEQLEELDRQAKSPGVDRRDLIRLKAVNDELEARIQDLLRKDLQSRMR